MISYLVAFLFASMTGAVLTLVVRNRALRYGWVDQARSSRKIHSKPIPRLGGVAIVLAFFAPLVALLLVDSSVGRTYAANPDLIVALFGGGLLIAALGLWDDFKGSGAKEKFAVQFLVAGGLYFLGFRVESIANPFGDAIQLGYLALPFTLLWIVGVINAVNLIDGLDGLAAGVAFFATATMFVLALSRGDVLMCLMMASLGGAILGFLVFNFNPASIFMGDTGSMFLGFVLAAASIKTSTKSHTTVAMLVPIIALGLPIMDTLLAVTRRALLGRPLFSADKEHIHHRLMSRLGVTHRRAVLILYALCCLFGLTALSLAFANGPQTALLLCGLTAVVALLMRKLGYLTLSNAVAATETRKTNLLVRSVARNIATEIHSATSLQDIWTAVRPMAEILGATRLELRFELRLNGVEEGVHFEARRDGGMALPLVCRVDAISQDQRLGQLFVHWCDGRNDVNRDEELALELIADAIGAAARRIPADAAAPLRMAAGHRA